MKRKQRLSWVGTGIFTFLSMFYVAPIVVVLFNSFKKKAFINLEVSPEQKAEFYPYIDSVLNVVECNCVTGDYSMLIEVRFKTTADLDHFVGELQRFGKTKTQIVFSTNVKHRCRYWKNDLHHDEEKK